MSHKYFTYDPDSGLETHPTAEKARQEAEDFIDHYRDNAADGWDEFVEQVCWGVITEQSVEIPTGQMIEFEGETVASVDYKLDDQQARSETAIYKGALEKWGLATQAMMAMGECGELISELNAFFNQSKSSQENVIDEIADVEIMCGQLRQIFGSDKVDQRKAFKLERLEGILSGSADHPHV